jgi:SAM-dependent methyltransferase
MGIDYAIYTVSGYQWYGDDRHPSFPLVGSTVFMAGASTLVGFGVLCFAEHSLLRSVGITSLCGIAYSLLGVFLLLPPLLRWYFSPVPSAGHAAGSVVDRVRRRYRTLEAYPRMFARFKLRYDPLFRDLARMLAQRSEIWTILDLGCGYGVPACWCLEQVPGARITALDPDPDRVRVSARAFGSSGIAGLGAAPQLPVADRAADVILLLDMLHYLDDQTLGVLLGNCRQALAPGGIVVTRFVIDPPGKRSWAWRLEDFRVKRAGLRPRYYQAAEIASRMTAAGLAVVLTQEATDDPELVWVVGRAADGRGNGA